MVNSTKYIYIYIYIEVYKLIKFYNFTTLNITLVAMKHHDIDHFRGKYFNTNQN